MMGGIFFRVVLVFSFVLAVIIFGALFRVAAPYGRHARRGWGPTLPGWLGWLLMESVSALGMLVMFLRAKQPWTVTTIIFLLMWEAHYLHRAFIYPFMRRDGRKSMPALVVVMGAAFNLGNAVLNGHSIYDLGGGRYGLEWLGSWQFVTGAALFIAGFIVNRQSDEVLRSLRGKGEQGYKIPYGGLYRYISCPNYLGEIIEWVGWALATWSWAGLAFAVWTFANLAPRAQTHHRWYRKNFSEYPMERRALLPGLW